MSRYYNIKSVGKVRVSDHEANTKLNGSSDLYFYTKSADNRKLCVTSQVEHYCDKHNLDITLFQEVLNDFPVEVYVPKNIEVEVVSQEFIDGYRLISGKKSTQKKADYCKSHGFNAYKISQGMYEVK